MLWCGHSALIEWGRKDRHQEEADNESQNALRVNIRQGRDLASKTGTRLHTNSHTLRLENSTRLISELQQCTKINTRKKKICERKNKVPKKTTTHAYKSETQLIVQACFYITETVNMPCTFFIMHKPTSEIYSSFFTIKRQNSRHPDQHKMILTSVTSFCFCRRGVFSSQRGYFWHHITRLLRWEHSADISMIMLDTLMETYLALKITHIHYRY